MSGKKKYAIERINVLALDSDEINSIKQRMVMVVNSSFEKASKNFLESYFEKASLYDNTHLLIKQSGRLIGYIVMKFYRYEINGRKYAISRPSAHFLPEYRRKNIFNSLLMKNIIYFYIKYLCSGIRLASLVDMASPFAYSATAKHFFYIYPNPVVLKISDVPKKYRALFQALLNDKKFIASGVKSLSNDFIVDHSLTIGRVLDDVKDQCVDNPRIKFYKKINPNYKTGNVLLVLIPVNFVNFAHLVYSRLINFYKKRIKKVGSVRDILRN